MKKIGFKARRSMCSLLAGCGLALALAAQALAAAPYYEGKTIQVIVPFPVAGGSDVWIRTIAPYLEKHMAGSPKFTVRNIGGDPTFTSWRTACPLPRP